MTAGGVAMLYWRRGFRAAGDLTHHQDSREEGEPYEPGEGRVRCGLPHSEHGGQDCESEADSLDRDGCEVESAPGQHVCAAWWRWRWRGRGGVVVVAVAVAAAAAVAPPRKRWSRRRRWQSRTCQSAAAANAAAAAADDPGGGDETGHADDDARHDVHLQVAEEGRAGSGGPQIRSWQRASDEGAHTTGRTSGPSSSRRSCMWLS